MTEFQKELFELQDTEYKHFHEKLIPTVDPNTVIGIRTPVLRKFAKEFSKRKESATWMKKLPHRYYEENNLHAFMLADIKDFDAALAEVEKFLPYVDNWATCDMFKVKVFGKNAEKLLPKIYEWLGSERTYTVRFAIGLLMTYFLDEKFSIEYSDAVAAVRSDEYYINMMAAWYFATALAKQYDAVIGYFEKKKLVVWVHNKAIQKAVESYRVTDENKAYLRTLKIKK